MRGKVHICETHRASNTSNHFLHEVTLWLQLSTQWAGTEGSVRTWLINYHLLGNLLLEVNNDFMFGSYQGKTPAFVGVMGRELLAYLELYNKL